jgi:hypothetical protein
MPKAQRQRYLERYSSAYGLLARQEGWPQ